MMVLSAPLQLALKAQVAERSVSSALAASGQGWYKPYCFTICKGSIRLQEPSAEQCVHTVASRYASHTQEQ